LQRNEILHDPAAAASQIGDFPGGRLATSKMAAEVDPSLYRQHGLRDGVIEAGCKTVIGSRLKQSGMFWTVEGANRIIALRCCRISGKFEDFWGQAHATA
jgi:hypothetical protein